MALNKLNTRLVIACGLLTILCHGHAQTKGAKPIRWATAQVDYESDNLGSNFEGHDCKTIAAALKKWNLKKDEFETSQQFETRTQEKLESVLYGNLRANDLLALVWRSRLEPSVKYDADSQSLNIEVPHPQPSLISGKFYSTAPLELAHTKNTKYTGSNAYGATRTVDKYVNTYCQVAFEQPRYDIRNRLVLQVNSIPPDKARSLKDSISIAYIGKLEKPYIGDFSSYFAPTIDSPTEIISNGDAIIIQLKAIWVVDRRTGDVLGKKIIQ